MQIDEEVPGENVGKNDVPAAAEGPRLRLQYVRLFPCVEFPSSLKIGNQPLSLLFGERSSTFDTFAV